MNNLSTELQEWLPIFYLAAPTLILLLIVGILKLRSNKQTITPKHLAGFVLNSFAKNKKVQETIKEVFHDAIKENADCDTVEEFKDYLTKKIAKKVYNILSKSKAGKLLTLSSTEKIVDSLLDSIIEDSEDDLESLYKKICSWDVTDDSEEVSTETEEKVSQRNSEFPKVTENKPIKITPRDAN